FLQLVEPGLELLDFAGEVFDTVPFGVGQALDRLVAGVEVGDDPAGNADDGRIFGYVRYDNRAGANGRMIAEDDGADYLCAGADGDVIAESWVALLALVARATESDALGQVAVIANDRRLADNETHAVVDEEPLAYASTRVDLDT